MEYIVTFNFNTINKNSKISKKNGEVEITTNASIEELKNSNELIQLISNDMKNKTKQTILSVEIIDIKEK